mmetsp:Transcript_43241/g.117044  ORF Transcript_43241/g.117044 Transcript_43241/m.117044 type:complete len:223 (-) Transcript_43241:8-676(-)
MVAAHAVLPGKLRLGHPLDRVRERDISLHQIVSDIHLALGVGAHVHAHDLVDVVADGEMKVRVKVAPGRLEVTEEQVLTLHLANVAPHRKILKEHLEVVVILNGISKALDLVGLQGLLAEEEPLHIVKERHLVGAGDFTVAHEVLAKFVVVALLFAGRAAKRERIVLVGLARIIERPDLVADDEHRIMRLVVHAAGRSCGRQRQRKQRPESRHRTRGGNDSV